MVFCVTGGTVTAGPAYNKTLKRFATKIAEKKGERFDQAISFIRTKLRFSLLKSTLIAIRGVRGKASHEPNMATIEYSLIPQKISYDS